MFFTLQLICYINYYVIVIPSTADLYVEQFKQIIEFKILKPDGFIKLFYPEFDLQEFIAGKKALILNKDQDASILTDLSFYIEIIGFIIIVLVIALIIAAITKYRKYILD